MKHCEPYKNVNIKLPSDLVSQIKIIAIQKDVFAKDLILDYLKKAVQSEKLSLVKNNGSRNN